MNTPSSISAQWARVRSGAQGVDWEQVAEHLARGTQAAIEFTSAAGAATWGGIRGAQKVAGAIWVADRPRRRRVRERRRRRWWRRRGWWRFLVAVEAIGVGGWIVGRTTWRMARATPSMAAGARTGAGAGWTQGRDRARARPWFTRPPVVEVTVQDKPAPRRADQPEDIVDAEIVDQAPEPAAPPALASAPTPSPSPTAPASTPVPQAPSFPGPIPDRRTAAPGSRIDDLVRLPDGSLGRPTDPQEHPDLVRPGTWARLPDGALGQITAVDGERIQVRTATGTRWIAPIDPSPDLERTAEIDEPVAPVVPPTLGGYPATDATTTQEEPPMTTYPPAHSSLTGGELGSPADLLTEIAHVNALAERAGVVESEIQTWARGLGDQITAAPWSTGAVAAAADAVSEFSDMSDLRQRISVLYAALGQADALGESLATVGATGSVEALSAP